MLLAEVRPLIATPPCLNSEDTDPWTRLEQRLGIAFPNAFKQFIDAYGPGMLDTNIRFHHPTQGTGHLENPRPRDRRVGSDG